jgi:hypothetical protein
MFTATIVILSFAAAAVLLSWAYFRRYAVARPPVGVFNLRDIAIMIGGVVLVPYLYLALPRWLVAGLLLLGVLSALYLLWEPVLAFRGAVWAVTLALGGYDIVAVLLFGPTSVAFFAVNNIVQMLVVIGLTNLWAQSGMRARDAAILAGLLAIYDIVATWALPLMTDLFGQLAGLPLAPLVAWPAVGGQWLGIGLGDLLLAAVYPLVSRKAFGRAAARLALALGLGGIAAVVALPALGLVRATFPVMVVLGPLTVLHFIYWRRRAPERSTWQYLLAEPLPIHARST